jgi:hypothetical protein
MMQQGKEISNLRGAKQSPQSTTPLRATLYPYPKVSGSSIGTTAQDATQTEAAV